MDRSFYTTVSSVSITCQTTTTTSRKGCIQTVGGGDRGEAAELGRQAAEADLGQQAAATDETGSRRNHLGDGTSRSAAPPGLKVGEGGTPGWRDSRR
jgi:hypothetical protein